MAFPIYLDDDSEARALADGLRRRGVDVLRSFDAGMRGRADAEHLRFATSLERVIVTANRGHFAALHAAWVREGRTHAGVAIIVQQQESIGEQVRHMLALQEVHDSASMRDRLEWLSNWGD